jgi:hypothetical protein
MSPAAGRDQPQDDPAEGGLAAAALADQRHHLAAVDAEADRAQRRRDVTAEGAGPVELGDLVDLEQAHDAHPWLTFQQATW